MQTIDEALKRLQTSNFRAGFRLKEKDKAYIRVNWPIDKIRQFLRHIMNGAIDKLIL